MYRFLIPVILLFFIVQDSPTLSWQVDYRLEWSDFKGAPKPKSNAAAVTASGISFSYHIKTTDTELIEYTYTVYADFYLEKSWYLKDRVTANILNHERLHFDITELFARKFRQRIKNTTFTLDIKNQMEGLHDTINAELEVMQQAYDSETDHSQNIKKQKEWQAKIILELNKLAYYSS